ncbi:MAG: META domain-containing protein [Chloroflexales bacterium]|nr:META domain-containing protein [Chloroflexales bacterium]
MSDHSERTTDTPDLMGTAWRLETYGPAGAPVAAPNGAEAMVTFGDDGRVTGDTGCNRFFGPYQIEGDEIVFGALGATRKACIGEERQRQEGALLAALRGDVRYELADDTLRLFAANDAVLTLASTPLEDDEG